LTIRIGIDAHMVGHQETGNETYVVGLIGGLTALEEPLELYVYHTGGVPVSRDERIHVERLLGNSSWIRLGVELPARSWTDRLALLHVTYSAPAWSRCPVILTVHDISFVDHPEWFSTRDMRVLSNTVPWSIRRAARVITVSELCRQQIIERFSVPGEKVVTIYNGPGASAQVIDQDEAKALVREIGIDPSRLLVLAVGNLQPRKNLVRLIGAFQQIVRHGVDADLVIVGPEHYRANLVHEAAAGLNERIHFTGYVSDRKLAALYASATVFAFPSLFEGFGIPAVEAMAHGTPIACSNTGALPEVCGEAAVYFDPLDSDSITSALEQVLTNVELRTRLSRAGRSRQQLFSWSNAAKETLAVYRSAITDV
jgi:glycosyltransferase involved in cell wall biosynthesis